MQLSGYGLLRIPLLGTSVNRGGATEHETQRPSCFTSHQVRFAPRLTVRNSGARASGR
jgi:hypothetical protein